MKKKQARAVKLLTVLRVAFYCQKCGDLVHFDLPVDGRMTKSYCCGARCRLTSKGKRVTVQRVKKQKNKKEKAR